MDGFCGSQATDAEMRLEREERGETVWGWDHLWTWNEAAPNTAAKEQPDDVRPSWYLLHTMKRTRCASHGPDFTSQDLKRYTLVL